MCKKKTISFIILVVVMLASCLLMVSCDLNNSNQSSSEHKDVAIATFDYEKAYSFAKYYGYSGDYTDFKAMFSTENAYK